jgi:hypothetical protein
MRRLFYILWVVFFLSEAVKGVMGTNDPMEIIGIAFGYSLVLAVGTIMLGNNHKRF